MADVTIESAASASTETGVLCGNWLVFTSSSVGYVFFTISTGNLVYRKTTDGGASWGSQVSILASVVGSVSVWFDGWTTGDSGTKIHLCYTSTTTDDWYYINLDTSTDTLGTQRTIDDTGADTSAGWSSITKSRAGNIILAYRNTDGSEKATRKSTDEFATNNEAIADLTEAAHDFFWLYPANAADAEDVWCVYGDDSAGEMSLKVYDDSADSWSEASIETSVDVKGFVTQEPSWSGAIRHSDGHLIFPFNNDADAAGADLRVYDINGSASITALANVITNTDDIYGAVLCIDQNTDDLYVAYAGTDDGSETQGSVVGIYYKKSTDDGSSWGTEAAMSETSDDHRALTCGQGGIESRFYVVWFNDDLSDLLGNSGNSIEITEPAPPSGFTPRMTLLGVG